MKITLELTDEQKFFLKKMHEALNGIEPIEKIASNMMSEGIVSFLKETKQEILGELKKGGYIA